ncbi:MAG TPA: serine hydrolase domain-containing protein [Roseiflexaceae bacterium]|nr:serine hydrolase domain-containing protein [Roseiflexaceae bacterium]
MKRTPRTTRQHILPFDRLPHVAVGALVLLGLLLLMRPDPQPHVSTWAGPASAPAPRSGLVGAARPVATASSGLAASGPIGAPLGPGDRALAQALERHMAGLASAGLFQGAVLVARDGQILLRSGYGMAETAAGTPNTPTTRFRLASVSKQFTAMAVMQLQAQGRLHVSDPICDYLSDCPDSWRTITIRQLLSHTSGIPDYTSLIDYSATQASPAAPAALAARVRDMPLLFPPGTSYSYGNTAYTLLGMIIEQASGRSYADVLRDGIFGPLQMHDSGVSTGAGEPGAARGYHRVGMLAPPLDASTLFAAGDLYSTVDDLYRWSQALEGETLLPAALRNEMFTPVANNYGYGWRITTPDGVRQISHPGLIDGFATAIVRFPDRRITVVVLANMDGADAPGIATYLGGLVLGAGE